MTPSPELAILRHLAIRRTHAGADEIATICDISPAEVRSCLVILESMRFISGRQDLDSRAPRRVYAITDEGRRKIRTNGGA